MLGLLGILLTIVTYVITERRTTGAAQERRKIAEKEVVELAYKLFVNDRALPDEEILRQIISSKAREHRVSAKRMPSLTMLMEDVTTKIVENDFIPAGAKKRTMQRIAVFQGRAARKEIPSEFKPDWRKQAQKDVLSDLSGSLVSTFGAAAVLSLMTSLFSPAFPVALILTVYSFIRRYRARLRQRDQEVQVLGPAFEDTIRSAVGRLDGLAQLRRRIKSDAYEFDAMAETKKGVVIVVEAKVSDTRIEAEVVRDFSEKLDAWKGEKKIRQAALVKGFIITNSQFSVDARAVAEKNGILLLDNIHTMQEAETRLRESISQL